MGILSPKVNFVLLFNVNIIKIGYIYIDCSVFGILRPALCVLRSVQRQEAQQIYNYLYFNKNKNNIYKCDIKSENVIMMMIINKTNKIVMTT